MTKYVFFRGRGKSEASATQQALLKCGDVLLNFPSLVVELVEMTPNASGYEAHVRVMAMSDSVDARKYKEHQNPHMSLEVKPSDDLGRKEGVENEGIIYGETIKKFSMKSFDLAVTSGSIPDLPTIDFDQFKGMGFSVEEVRSCLNNRRFMLQQQLNLDKH